MKHSIYSDKAQRNNMRGLKLLDQSINSLLLDMDGTLLDLHFDNFFWQQLLPLEYAKMQQLDAASAAKQLQALIAAQSGTANFYDVEYWSDRLNLDVMSLKRAYRHKIALLAGSGEFLRRSADYQTIIITNAHPASLALKLLQMPQLNAVNKIISAFEYGFCKEQAPFWQALQADLNLNPSSCALFDDNLQVLSQAQKFGIAQLFLIAKPDSQKPNISAKHSFIEINTLLDLCL